MTLNLRRIWLRAHLYLGLSLGLLFALLGLTGSFLVFNHTIDEWLNPGLLLRSGPGPDRPLAAIAAAGVAAHADLTPAGRLLMTPRHPGGVPVVYTTEKVGDEYLVREAHVDPATARVLGRRAWGEYFVAWIYVLHSHLHAGERGETVVGLAGVFLVLSTATGLVLWWPIVRKGGLRAATRLKRAHLNFDLHKLAGVAASLGLLVVAISGVYLVFPNWFRAPMAVVSTPTKHDPVHSRPAPAGTPDVDLDAALATAQARFPDARLIAVQLPIASTDPIAFTFRRAGEVRRTWGRCGVWVDRRDGSVLKVRDGGDQTAADVFAEWQFPLHNGEALGLPGRWLVFATGLSPTLLGITGTALWWRKRRSKARQQARKLGRPAPAAVLAAN